MAGLERRCKVIMSTLLRNEDFCEFKVIILGLQEETLTLNQTNELDMQTTVVDKWSFFNAYMQMDSLQNEFFHVSCDYR
ncbi:hypothetical protein STEG23_022757 [Scotinomys teguina]